MLGEFVFGQPGQDPNNATAQGPLAAISVPWADKRSFMLFGRLEQKVPEFRAFVQQQAEALGMDSELLATRMVGRWRSGAPTYQTRMPHVSAEKPVKTPHVSRYYGPLSYLWDRIHHRRDPAPGYCLHLLTSRYQQRPPSRPAILTSIKLKGAPSLGDNVTRIISTLL
jgi:hypothetical protein